MSPNKYQTAKPIIEQYILPVVIEGFLATKKVMSTDNYTDAQFYGFAFWKLIFNRMRELVADPDIPITHFKNNRFIFLIEKLAFRFHRADYETGSPVSGKTIKSCALQNKLCIPGVDINAYTEHTTTILGVVAPTNKELQQVFLGRVIVDDITKKRFKSVERVFVYNTLLNTAKDTRQEPCDVENNIDPVVKFIPVEAEAKTIVQLSKPIRVPKRRYNE